MSGAASRRNTLTGPPIHRPRSEPVRRTAEDFAEELTQEIYDHATNITLPLTARLKPRGFFQDDWRPRPTGARPWPIVLIHGSGASKGSWRNSAGNCGARLGFLVFAPDFGDRASAPIAESAAQIGAYIDAVLLVTGAAQVVLVGQFPGRGGRPLLMRTYGGYMKVRHMVSLSVPNHGTLMGGILHPVTAAPGRRHPGEADAQALRADRLRTAARP